MSGLLVKGLVTSGVGQFAKFLRAYQECTPEIQAVVVEMCGIISDDDLPAEDRDYASDVVMEALFPGLMADMSRSLDGLLKSPEGIEAERDLDAEEQTFADRVRSAMKRRNLSQKELAELASVTQPAISNILSRQCRPQRRTVVRLAEAIGTTADELWPE